MSNYRRVYVEGATYFFTLVTYNRTPIFLNEQASKLFYNALEYVQNSRPFETVASVLLPDHFHCLWQLPEKDSDYSMRWKEVKRFFARGYLRIIGSGGERNTSRIKRKETAIWQRRFWEHTIQDDKDLKRHVDYIHYNPIKHGFVSQLSQWPHSSFHDYVTMGYYPYDWAELPPQTASAFKYGE